MNGLVEKFNSTLIEMIAKYLFDKPLDWDSRLPYFTVSQLKNQPVSHLSIWSMIETLRFLHPQYCHRSKVFTVWTLMTTIRSVSNLSQVWDLARAKTERALKRQKFQYDKKASTINLQVGNQVMVYMQVKVKERITN